jgi:hypothetical protein
MVSGCYTVYVSDSGDCGMEMVRLSFSLPMISVFSPENVKLGLYKI